MEILISDRQKINLDKRAVKDLGTYTLNQLKHEKNLELSISFVLTAEIKKLNKRFCDKDASTEVLSFFLKDEEAGNNMLGEIVICPAEVKARCTSKSEMFNHRIGLLLVHSILHLTGYSHRNDKDAKVMAEKEENLLDGFGYKKLTFI